MKFENAIKQSKFESSQQKAMLNIMYTANWLRDEQAELFKSYDLLPQHYNVLRIIKGKHPLPVSPSDIKEVMIDKGNDVTRLVDKLVKLKLVDRNLCPENRRKIDINLTKQGLKLIDEISKQLLPKLKHIKNRLSEKDADILSDLLDKLRD
ncbi:MAG: MarR family winged helix-turn-helix transcriptional regulator [Sphingobacteriaceae bacterium]|jgi:DNA-binding MarR family transcriptional regulator